MEISKLNLIFLKMYIRIFKIILILCISIMDKLLYTAFSGILIAWPYL